MKQGYIYLHNYNAVRYKEQKIQKCMFWLKSISAYS